MIICAGGKVALKGTMLELQTDLTCIMSEMVKECVLNEEQAKFSVELAFMDDDELEEKTKESVASLLTMDMLAKVVRMQTEED